MQAFLSIVFVHAWPTSDTGSVSDTEPDVILTEPGAVECPAGYEAITTTEACHAACVQLGRNWDDGNTQQIDPEDCVEDALNCYYTRVSPESVELFEHQRSIVCDRTADCLDLQVPSDWALSSCEELVANGNCGQEWLIDLGYCECSCAAAAEAVEQGSILDRMARASLADERETAADVGDGEETGVVVDGQDIRDVDDGIRRRISQRTSGYYYAGYSGGWGLCTPGQVTPNTCYGCVTCQAPTCVELVNWCNHSGQWVHARKMLTVVASCPVEVNVNYPGNDLNAGGLVGRIPGHLTRDECRRACKAFGGCQSWSFDTVWPGDNCAVKYTTKANGNRVVQHHVDSGEVNNGYAAYEYAGYSGGWGICTPGSITHNTCFGCVTCDFPCVDLVDWCHDSGQWVHARKMLTSC